MVLTLYRARSGKVTPGLCSSSVDTIYMFFFGSETQDVYYCTKDNKVAKSEDTALQDDSDDAVYSAQYKAYPAKQNGHPLYNSVLTTKPILQKEVDFDF